MEIVTWSVTESPGAMLLIVMKALAGLVLMSTLPLLNALLPLSTLSVNSDNPPRLTQAASALIAMRLTSIRLIIVVLAPSLEGLAAPASLTPEPEAIRRFGGPVPWPPAGHRQSLPK